MISHDQRKPVASCSMKMSSIPCRRLTGTRVSLWLLPWHVLNLTNILVQALHCPHCLHCVRVHELHSFLSFNFFLFSAQWWPDQLLLLQTFDSEKLSNVYKVLWLFRPHNTIITFQTFNDWKRGLNQLLKCWRRCSLGRKVSVMDGPDRNGLVACIKKIAPWR